jgi:ankyrin repeat protein
VVITSDKHTENLAPLSSHQLFHKARETSSDYKTIRLGTSVPSPVRLVDRLFANSEEAIQLGLRQPMQERKFVYVNETGQLYGDALHIAVINKDPELVKFLIQYERGIKPNENLSFPGLHSIVKDGAYHSQWTTLIGTPLKAAANSYAQIQHQYPLRADNRERAKPWQKMMKLLIDHGATWSAFADKQPLLGRISHMNADGQSMLARAMDYNDSWTFKSIIKAAKEGKLTIDWLPCSHFFNFDHCAGFKILQVRKLSQSEVRQVIGVLHDEERTFGKEDDLEYSVPEILWRKLPDMDISPPLMAELLHQVLSLIPLDPPPGSCWTVASNLAHLLQCKHPKPNMREWASVNNYASILHYIAEKKRTDVMRTLLEAGHVHFINKENDDGETPLDIAKRVEDLETYNLLLEHNADAGHSTQGTGTPNSKQKAKRSGLNELSSPASEPPPWSPYLVKLSVGGSSPSVLPQRSSQELSGLRRSQGETENSNSFSLRKMLDIFKGTDTSGTGSPVSSIAGGLGRYQEIDELLNEQSLLLDSSACFQQGSNTKPDRIMGKTAALEAESPGHSTPDSARALTRTNTVKALLPSPPVSATELSITLSIDTKQSIPPERNHNQEASPRAPTSKPAVPNTSQINQPSPPKPLYAEVVRSPSRPLNLPSSYSPSLPKIPHRTERADSIGVSQPTGGAGVERTSSPSWPRKPERRHSPRSSINHISRPPNHSPLFSPLSSPHPSSSRGNSGHQDHYTQQHQQQQQDQQPRQGSAWWSRGTRGSSSRSSNV